MRVRLSSDARRAGDWYHIGNSLVNLSLADLATGPVDRVWYSADGGTLYATTASGKTFETQDFETWKQSTAVAAEPSRRTGRRSPRRSRARHRINGSGPRLCVRQFRLLSQNLGASWDNLTALRIALDYRRPRDLAVSPRDSEEVTVATSAGVFRSLDGGKSWSGLNPRPAQFSRRRAPAQSALG